MAKVESERIKLELQEQKQRMDAMRAEMELQIKMATMAMQSVPDAKGVVISGGIEAPEGEEYGNMEGNMEEREPALIQKMDLEESTFERLTRVIQEQISRLVNKNIEDTSKMQVMEIDALKQGQTQIVQLLNELRLRDEQPVPQETQDGGPQIERGPDGMVVSINGRPVKRDEQGRLMGVE